MRIIYTKIGLIALLVLLNASCKNGKSKSSSTFNCADGWRDARFYETTDYATKCSDCETDVSGKITSTSTCEKTTTN